MTHNVPIVGVAAALALASPLPPAAAQDGTTAVTPQATQVLQSQQMGSETRSLDDLLQQFDAQQPQAPGGVKLDAWIESNDAGKEVVVVVAPEGEVKLVADPGITVTPGSRLGVNWQGPVPHRMVDPERAYFDPPAMVRLPVTVDDGRPVKVLVEYAYCLVDYQCFFGEEELTVATATP
ncbi:MAG: hypothetical protein AAF637_11300 [Pseudomonadota bacterium]